MNFKEINIGKYKLSSDGPIREIDNSEFSQLYLKCSFLCLDSKLLKIDINTNSLTFVSGDEYPKCNGQISVRDYIQTDEYIIQASENSLDLIPMKKRAILKVLNNSLMYNGKVYDCKESVNIEDGYIDTEFTICPEKDELTNLKNIAKK